MASRHIAAFALIAVLIASGPASAKPVLEPSPREVDLGQFKVGQQKECRVSIRNAGDTDVEIEQVTSSCACVSARIDRQLIPAGRSASLNITAERPYPGPFSYSAIIIPKRKDQIEPLRIPVRGEAVSSVSAQVGWQGGVLQNVVYPNPIDLGIRHGASANPIVVIASRDGSDLGNFVTDANSLHFCLDRADRRSAGASHSRTIADGSRHTLRIAFRPRTPLEPGRLQDTLEIRLADGSKLYIPIVCLIVGDVYVDQQTIHLGKLARSPERKLHVLFAGNAKRWRAAHWEGAGLLYDAIAVRDASVGQTAGIALVLAIDQTKVSRLPQGYVFCRMRLYENPRDPGLTVFIDGYN